MKLCPTLLSRRAGVFTISRLLRESSTTQAATTAASHDSADAGAVPAPAASLQALTKLLRKETRKPMREGLSSSSSPSFSSWFPAEGRLRSQFDAEVATEEASAKALWDAASTWYYRSVNCEGHRTLIVPFDWQSAVRAVASELPYEGVTEASFVHRLTSRIPGMPASSAAELASLLGYDGLPSLAGWVWAHFSEAVLVTRSATTGEPLYHNRANNGFFPRTTASTVAGLSTQNKACRDVAALQHALHLLGRDKQLPLWTDFYKLAPLLPANVCPAAGEWQSFLSQPHIQSLFEVKADISVRYAGRPTTTHIFVDRTSVSSSEAAAWLAKQRSAETVREAPPDIKILVRPGGDKANEDSGGGCENTKCQNLSGALRGAEVVVVEPLLDPEHVIGALLDTAVVSHSCPAKGDGEAPTGLSEAAEDDEEGDGLDAEDQPAGAAKTPVSQRIVHVLCGEGSVDAVVQALRGVQQQQQQRQDGPLALFVHTPIEGRCVAVHRNESV